MTEPILYETLPSGIARIVLNRAERGTRRTPRSSMR